ncbi:MAG: hypothetical protein IIX86_09010 [Clostridia bacterium]|nr:hypothetical protein [Clostridia bacterium]
MSKYFYNDIELPKIPSRDETIYPYAVISKVVGNDYIVQFFQKPYRVNTTTTAMRGFVDYVNGDIYVFSAYDVNTKEWMEQQYYTVNTDSTSDDYRTPRAYFPKWSNYDLYATDGTLLLPASDPVPVTTLTARDLYRKINGKPTKLTLYKKLGGKLVPLDEHTKEVKT